jgi:Fur family ferric uptake transcriptional regulator
MKRLSLSTTPNGSVRQVSDNHHRIICRACGAIAYTASVLGHARCLERGSRAGFVIYDAEVTFWGTCSSCQSCARAADPGAE